MIVVLVIGGQKLGYQPSGNIEDGWDISPEPAGRPDLRVELERDVLVEIEVGEIGTVQAKLKLNEDLAGNARWFGRNRFGGDYVKDVAARHVAGWIDYALHQDETRPATLDDREWLALRDPTGIILPGRIYRVAELVIPPNPMVLPRAMASEGLPPTAT